MIIRQPNLRFRNIKQHSQCIIQLLVLAMAAAKIPPLSVGDTINNLPSQPARSFRFEIVLALLVVFLLQFRQIGVSVFLVAKEDDYLLFASSSTQREPHLSKHETSKIPQNKLATVDETSKAFFVVQNDAANTPNKESLPKQSSPKNSSQPLSETSGATITNNLILSLAPFDGYAEASRNIETALFPRDAILEKIDDFFTTRHSSKDVEWLRDYLYWHRHMRRTFTNEQLFDNNNPNAPKVLVIYSIASDTHKGGGLTDRLKILGGLLRQSFDQDRLLFIKWFNTPTDLEVFLEPHLFNWTLPDLLTYKSITSIPKVRKKSKRARILRSWPIGIIPFEDQFMDPFDTFWHATFRPSASVQKAIDETMTSLGLQPGQYDAVHCRVNHPAFMGKSKINLERDIHGHGSFEGKFRENALEAAYMGVQCARVAGKNRASTAVAAFLATQQKENQSQVYFYSDFHPLVRAVASDGTNAYSVPSENDTISEKLSKLQSETRIVGRVNATISHLQNHGNNVSIDAFSSTFVDLYVASQARCIGVGVGNFGYLAARIGSRRPCWVRH